MRKFPALLALCALASIGLAGCGEDKPDAAEYTVTFKNYDGSLLSESKVKEGNAAAYNGQTPFRADTPEYKYTFSGWDQSLENVTGDCVRVAQFIETYKPVATYYTVFFLNYDGSALFETSVIEGGTAVYEGIDPVRPETEECKYAFSGWDKSLENITADCVRVAQYSETAKPVAKYCTVTFQNYDGTVLTTDVVESGGTATYGGPALSRPETAEYTYVFSGWDKPLENIESDCIRVAQYSEIAKPVTLYYTVTFKNYDGSILQELSVEAGHDAIYGGLTPTRPETAEYTYSFSGWDQPLENINGDCIRIAQYTEIAKPTTAYYTVTFKNYDDSILHQALVEEGGTAIYGGLTPTRPDNAEFSFSFVGWDESLENINGNCIRVAQYEETYIEYAVRFFGYDNQLLYTDVVHYKESASYYGPIPTKPSTSTHHYAFKGWDKDLTSITKSIDVKALFDEYGDEKNIAINPNNDQEGREIEIVYGESYNLGIPSFPGFIFLGWYSGETLIPTTGVWEYGDINSVTAKWASDYFEFADNGDNTYAVSLTDNGKAASEIIIPARYNGISVSALGENFAKQDTSIEKLVIPGIIKNIPDYAFYYCSKLREVSLFEGLISIGQHAFEADALEKLLIPSTCTSIGRSAFDYNRSLYHIYIPRSVATIGAYAFDVLTDVTYICIEHEAIPSGWDSNWSAKTTYTSCTKLVEGEDYNYVLRDVYGSKSATILRLSEESSKSLDFSFPSEIEGISEIRIGQKLFFNNLYIHRVNFAGVSRINGYAFSGCKNLESISFSSSLSYIGTNAFRYCSALTRVEIPDSVTEIGSFAFDSCSSLS